VRLPLIGYSFYGDEQFSVLRDSTNFITNSEDRFRPLFFSLLYLWRRIGFEGEIGLRLLPLLFGVAQIPVAWFVGRRLGGVRLARVLSILVAASPMLIEFSQELRMYSMVALLALLQALTYLRLMERATLGRWLMFVLIAVLGVYAHLHYWIFLAGFAAAFLVERRSLPLWQGWGALAATVALYLPNVPNVQHFAAVRAGEYTVHLPSALPKLMAAFTVGFNYVDFVGDAPGRPVAFADLSRNLPVLLLAAIPALIIFWFLVRLHRRKPLPRSLVIGHTLSAIPVLLALLASAVTRQYWVQPKYVIFSAPFVLLLIADAYCDMSSVILRRVTAALGTAVLVIALLHFWSPQEYGRRENWREASQLLKSRLKPNSALVLVSGSYGMLTYYWPEVRDQWQIINVPDIPRPSADYVNDLRRRLSGKQEVFYLWNNVFKNESDPGNVLMHSLDLVGTRIGTVQLNPRFKLFQWKLTEMRKPRSYE
jgi:uncharacterized membrane protein